MKTLKTFLYTVSAAALLTVQCFAASPETQSLYKAKCQACHGVDGTASPIGKKMGALDFTSPDVMKLSDADLIDATTKGKNKMPAFKDKLKDAEIKDLIAYVKELGKKK